MKYERPCCSCCFYCCGNHRNLGGIICMPGIIGPAPPGNIICMPGIIGILGICPINPTKKKKENKKKKERRKEGKNKENGISPTYCNEIYHILNLKCFKIYFEYCFELIVCLVKKKIIIL